MFRVLLVNFIFIVHQKRHLIETAAKSIVFVPTLSNDGATGKIFSFDYEEEKS
jgi:hypothetical protein